MKIQPELLLSAYAKGAFPMAMEDDQIGWFSPDPRGIIPIHDFHSPHGLCRALRKYPWQFSTNAVFPEVIRQCAARPQTWINKCIINSYQELHDLGFAHSVEIWLDGVLAGGLYGVALRGAFFGESMFTHYKDASKVALYGLIQILKQNQFLLLDTQWITPHLAQFGAQEISKEDYLQRLQNALAHHAQFPTIFLQNL